MNRLSYEENTDFIDPTRREDPFTVDDLKEFIESEFGNEPFTQQKLNNRLIQSFQLVGGDHKLNEEGLAQYAAVSKKSTFDELVRQGYLIYDQEADTYQHSI